MKMFRYPSYTNHNLLNFTKLVTKFSPWISKFINAMKPNQIIIICGQSDHKQTFPLIESSNKYEFNEYSNHCLIKIEFKIQPSTRQQFYYHKFNIIVAIKEFVDFQRTTEFHIRNVDSSARLSNCQAYQEQFKKIQEGGFQQSIFINSVFGHNKQQFQQFLHQISPNKFRQIVPLLQYNTFNLQVKLQILAYYKFEFQY
ncbi:unnamed protein product (macronuclear) [Paramecium tetraurelia]|uniref:Uncharacterized protein n=1 Tax=Paramecium tetraurelia TaxID=5888 RepID=A0C7A6_PARTE|nr:uncharacterized protein GSPATT00035803001 [Paramecium tetraurelia]CAK66673.1 unnamed protein product [Paramecium tetraurelia]|eukprot:XP_001434070.1 hypothetical protein (macronuclear) [Paramecium tetraurelia strain d4-2]